MAASPYADRSKLSGTVDVEAQAAEPASVIIAHFQDDEDAGRAIIELREVEFPAESIQVTSKSHAAHEHVHPTEAGAPNTSASAASAATLPNTSFTTLMGGSPFGEASEHEDDAPASGADGKPSAASLSSGETLITIRTTPERAAAAESILHRNNARIQK